MVLQTYHTRTPMRSWIYSPLISIAVDIQVPKSMIMVDFPSFKFADKRYSNLLLTSFALGPRSAEFLELAFGELEQRGRARGMDICSVALKEISISMYKISNPTL
jgi:hypothetical protein